MPARNSQALLGGASGGAVGGVYRDAAAAVCQARMMPKAMRPRPEMTVMAWWTRRPASRRTRVMAVDKTVNQVAVPRPMPASHVTGTFDYLLRADLPDAAALDRLLRELKRRAGVAATNTRVILRTTLPPALTARQQTR
jgi:DNA-binding Lrp family transcriptional regulator